MANMKKRTQHSSFGVSGRFSHDSEQFYSQEIFKETGYNKGVHEPITINKISNDYINHIFCQSSNVMNQLPDSSVHLMITSPPYNVSKDYDKDLSLSEYREMLKGVWRETKRVLIPGGRVCINIANIGRKPYIPLHRYIIEDMIDLGFFMHGEIIWNKGASAGTSMAWGSWMSASAPCLRDVHEYILVFSNGTFIRNDDSNETTIDKNEFMEWTKSVWNIDTVSAKKSGHPAPFPEDIPKRLIRLYSFKDDVILDPFVGIGTTCVAAVRDQRKYVGYDISERYIRIAQDNLWRAESQEKWFNM